MDTTEEEGGRDMAEAPFWLRKEKPASKEKPVGEETKHKKKDRKKKSA